MLWSTVLKVFLRSTKTPEANPALSSQACGFSTTDI